MHMIDDFLRTILSKFVVSHVSFKLTGDALDRSEQLQESKIWQGQKEIIEWFDMRQFMKDHFIHCDDVESSLFTSAKVEDDNIIDLFGTFNVEVEILTSQPKIGGELRF